MKNFNMQTNRWGGFVGYLLIVVLGFLLLLIWGTRSLVWWGTGTADDVGSLKTATFVPVFREPGPF